MFQINPKVKRERTEGGHKKKKCCCGFHSIGQQNAKKKGKGLAGQRGKER